MPSLNFLICTGIYPPEIGGPATVVAKLVTDLKQAGHKVHVLTYGDEDANANGVTHISRKRLLPFRYLSFASAVRRHLEPETIVFSTDVFSTGIPVRLALIGTRNRLFIRLGGEWCWEDAVTKGRFYGTLRVFWARPRISLRDRLMRANYRWTLMRASRIYLTADFLKEIVARIVPRAEGRMSVVQNRAGQPSPLHMQGGDDKPHKPLHLLYVGRFAPVKNVPFLARVIKRLHDESVPIVATFAGSGPDEAEVKKILAGVPRISLLGNLPSSELSKLYGEADIFVLPSLSDICPNAVLEALAAGVPCIITSEHGLGRLGGVVEVDPTDEKAWTDVLKRFADVRLYDELRTKIAYQSSAGQNLSHAFLRDAEATS